MSKLKTYHILPNVNGGWQMQEEGTGLACIISDIKQEVMAQAREIAHARKPSRVFIHKEDGTILAGHTYRGYPPCRVYSRLPYPRYHRGITDGG